MFEFGRDLRRLFAQARESEDLSWLELIGVDLLAVEARQQCTDAGRVSCARPHPAWLRGAALWREHARRTGSADSVRKALGAALDAARQARTPEEIARAAVEKALTLLLRFRPVRRPRDSGHGRRGRARDAGLQARDGRPDLRHPRPNPDRVRPGSRPIERPP
jgi:hypothetical protein